MSDGRVAALLGPRELKSLELPVPALGPEEALLRVEACGMCYSDVEYYLGKELGLGPLPYPWIPGHEFVGRIEAIGDDAAAKWNVSEGARVAVAGLLASIAEFTE
jgi:D-arabinose 1-dehydrogenase-like Zn-dependent alcohol dehydrogenase